MSLPQLVFAALLQAGPRGLSTPQIARVILHRLPPDDPQRFVRAKVLSALHRLGADVTKVGTRLERVDHALHADGILTRVAVWVVTPQPARTL